MMDTENTISQEARQAQKNFEIQQNRTNLLLVKEYKLRKQQQELNADLKIVNQLIANLKHSAQNPSPDGLSRAVRAEDEYLRTTIKNNSVTIKDLERKIEIQDLVEKCDKLAEVHDNFRKVLNFEYEKTKIRETMGALRTRIDEIKKKGKDVVKELQALEEAQKSQIDELSHQTETLREEEAKVLALKEQIRLRKQHSK